MKIYEYLNQNILISLNGVQNLPRDQEIFSWWGGAGDIYFVFHAVDDLIINLWIHFLKSFNFIEWFGFITRRPGNFLLVGWGWEYLFCASCSWLFDCKSMNSLSKSINFIERLGAITRRPGDFLVVGLGCGYLFCVSCSWQFDYKSMKTFSKIF